MGSLMIIIGIGFIAISLLLIIKEKNEETRLYKDILIKHKEITEYTNIIEDIVENLDSVIENFFIKFEDRKLENMTFQEVLKKEYQHHHGENSSQDKGKDQSGTLSKVSNKIKQQDNNIKDEIIRLKSLGLSTQEIAKHMNKGIREIDILIKMYEKNSK